ncbi:MAG: hypothetical protein OHK0039_40590 [Bacteroidia bacterium]
MEQDSLVYVMFTVNDDPASVDHRRSIHTPILYLDMFFQVNTTGGETMHFKTAPTAVRTDYADFPRPCPPTCP